MARNILWAVAGETTAASMRATTLILSGFLRSDAPAILDAYATHNFQLLDTITIDDWTHPHHRIRQRPPRGPCASIMSRENTILLTAPSFV